MPTLFRTSHRSLGFSVIELCIAAVVVALIGLVTFTAYDSFEKKSRDTKRIDDVAYIVKALESYYNKNHSYPSSSGSQVISTTWSTTADASWDALKSSLTPFASKGIPTDPHTEPGLPIGGYNYAYFSNPEGKHCGAEANQMYLLVYKLESTVQSNTFKGLCETAVLMPYKGVSNYRMTHL